MNKFTEVEVVILNQVMIAKEDHVKMKIFFAVVVNDITKNFFQKIKDISKEVNNIDIFFRSDYLKEKMIEEHYFVYTFKYKDKTYEFEGARSDLREISEQDLNNMFKYTEMIVLNEELGTKEVKVKKLKI